MMRSILLADAANPAVTIGAVVASFMFLGGMLAFVILQQRRVLIERGARLASFGNPRGLRPGSTSRYAGLAFGPITQSTCVEGTIGGVEIALFQGVPAKNQSKVTTIVARSPRPLPATSVVPRGSVDGFTRMFATAPPLPTGDPAFDARFEGYGDSPAALHHVVGPGARAALVALPRVPQQLYTNGSHIAFVLPEWEEDDRVLDAAVEIVVRVATGR